MGRLAGPRLYGRSLPQPRRRAGSGRARDALAQRGGVIIVVARYFPGARTVVTLTAGAVEYGWRRFAAFGAVPASRSGAASGC